MALLSLSDKTRLKTELFKIGIPTAIEFILLNLIDFSDNFMVAYLGETTIAAVAIANKLIFILYVVEWSLSGVISILVPRINPNSQEKELKNSFLSLVLVAVIFSIPFVVIALFFPKWFMHLFIEDLNVINIGRDYLVVIAISYIFASLKIVIVSALRAIKISKIQAKVAFIFVILNVILNYIFIFKFNMGVKGAALATFIVRFLECLFYILFTLFNKKSPYYFKRNAIYLNDKFLIQVLKLFLPIFCNEIIWTFGYIILNAIYARVGIEEYAAYTLALNFVNLIFASVHAFNLAFTIVLSHEMNRERGEILKIAFFLNKVGATIALSTSSLLLIVSFLLPYFLTNFLHSNLISSLLVYFAVSTFFTALSMQNLNGIFRAGGDASFAAIVETIVTFFYTVPLAYFLAFYVNLPFQLVVFFPALEDALKIAVGIPYLYSGKWLKKL